MITKNPSASDSDNLKGHGTGIGTATQAGSGPSSGTSSASGTPAPTPAAAEPVRSIDSAGLPAVGSASEACQWRPTTHEDIERLRASAVAVPGGSEISLMLVPGFVSATEADHLMAIAAASPKGFVQSAGGGDNSTRTSTSCITKFYANRPVVSVFPRGDVILDDVISRIGRLIDQNAWQDVEYMELIRYSKGQQFRTHQDSYDYDTKPRPVTMFLYLNDLGSADGGCTNFPNLDISLRPEKGTVSVAI